jgi:integrase
MRRSQYIKPEKEKTPWSMVSQEYLKARRAKLQPRTIESYEGILGRWLSRWDAKPIGRINNADIWKLLDDIRDPRQKGGTRTAQTEHRIFNVVSAVFKHAVKHGYVQKSPADDMRDDLRSTAHSEFQARALTLAEANAIIDELPAGRNRLYALVGLHTGLRAGELAGLRVRNLDRLSKSPRKPPTVTVDETVEDLATGLRPGTPKTPKSRGRKVPVPKWLMEELGAYVDEHQLKHGDYLFAGQGTYFVHKLFARRQWKRACQAARIKARFYDLRHTFASRCAQRGVPPHLLQYWMGHTSITTTFNIYTHVYDDDSMEAILTRLYEPDEAPASNVVELPAEG